MTLRPRWGCWELKIISAAHGFGHGEQPPARQSHFGGWKPCTLVQGLTAMHLVHLAPAPRTGQAQAFTQGSEHPPALNWAPPQALCFCVALGAQLPSPSGIWLLLGVLAWLSGSFRALPFPTDAGESLPPCLWHPSSRGCARLSGSGLPAWSTESSSNKHRASSGRGAAEPERNS